jgi:hypothetical protein
MAMESGAPTVLIETEKGHKATFYLSLHLLIAFDSSKFYRLIVLRWSPHSPIRRLEDVGLIISTVVEKVMYLGNDLSSSSHCI